MLVIMVGAVLVLYVCVSASEQVKANDGHAQRRDHLLRREHIAPGGDLGIHPGPHRDDGRCGPEFGHAACNALSEYPCCSLEGFCGNLDTVHCQCHGCTDFRHFVSESAVAGWHAEVWQNACGSLRKDMPGKDGGLVALAEVCPYCVPGKLAVPGADAQNVEVSDEVVAIKELDSSKWGRCFMEWRSHSEFEVPRSLWRIDVLSTSSRKVPSIRWPCTVQSAFPHTGAQVLTHMDARRWSRMMLASKDDFFTVDNALDIGASVGHTALRLGLFTHGRTIALEAQPRRYELLKFFAEINPDLDIDAYNVVVDADRSGDRVPVMTPVDLIQRNYGEAFLDKVGFVNINMGIDAVKIFRSLGTLLRRAQPAVHIAWETGLALCAADGLFAALKEADYAAHNPDTGARIMQPSTPKGCEALENSPWETGEQNLFLLPMALLNRAGPLANRWNERALDPSRYVKPLLSPT